MNGQFHDKSVHYREGSSKNSERALSDRFAILATLNVNGFTFEDSVLTQIPLTSTHSPTTTTSIETMPRVELRQKGSSYGVNVSVITQLHTEVLPNKQSLLK